MGNKTKKQVGAILGNSGVTFRVWAPFADSVALVGSFNSWSEQLLHNEGDGYWSDKVRKAFPGQEYKYIIRHGEETLVRNDPRARHLTTSAGTAVITNNLFDWESDSFVPPPIEEQVIYEVHIGTFNRPDPAINGTFYNLMDKLDYLKELGVNMIELMPINSMLMDRGWGYAIDYIFAVESLYGGRHGFMQFVKSAHAKGIGVILDVVFNHFGPDNALDIWNFDGWHEDGYGGIYFYNDWHAETPWGRTRPDFGRSEVRQYILDNISMWIHDCHVDGLRVDSTHFIRNVKGNNDDPSNDLADGWLLLQQINSVARKINSKVITIAEDLACNQYITKTTKEGGAGFSAQWELNFPFVLRQVLASNDPAKIELSNLLEELSRQYTDNAFARVIYADSHDSAANGSARLIEIIAPGKTDSLFARQQALISAVILLSAPGVPMLFQGQEFLQNGAFNDWQGLDWLRAERYAGIIKAYQHLIALRKNQWGNTRGLTGGNINLFHVDQVNKVIAYHRWHDGGAGDDVIIVINFGKHSFKDYKIKFPLDGVWRTRFNSTWNGYDADFKNHQMQDFEVVNGDGIINLPPDAGLIFSQDR